jgi:hypothetical protein
MVNLQQHQKEAVNKLHNGCILCGGVGTGKSITALAYYVTKVCGGRINSPDQVPYITLERNVDLYIITTARKRDTHDWEKEMMPFALAINVVIDSWNNVGKYTNVKNAFFIFDEQRVVGKGAWVKSFLKITKSNQWILLSATPGDNWEDYIPVFIANGFYRSRREFTESHVIWKAWAKYPIIQKYYNEGVLIKQRNQVLVHMIKKKETHPHHETIYLPYDIAASDIALKRRKNPYTGEPIVDAAELCRILRKIANED